MLSTEEAAARLGVKVTTLYAYVSRGLLCSHSEPGGRRSRFAVEDIEALATRGRGGRQVESRTAVVNTSVTRLGPHGPEYRGARAVDLVGASYETVAEQLWDAGPPTVPWVPFPLHPLPDEVRRLDRRSRFAWTTLMVGAADPVRSANERTAVLRAARRLIASMVATQPGEDPLNHRDQDGRSLAVQLAHRLGAATVTPALERIIDAVMVLLADHELATSTLAVRVAASTRADLYDAVAAGLATVAGPLHGSASAAVVDLLERAERDGSARALDDALRWQGMLPGFGHAVYDDGDPRVGPLLELLGELSEPTRSRVDELVSLAADHGLPAPNVDLTLGAISVAVDADRDAMPAVFTVARTAGWVAHYLEELEEPPVRFRARAVHVTPR